MNLTDLFALSFRGRRLELALEFNAGAGCMSNERRNIF
jgi:hypothetical protein